MAVIKAFRMFGGNNQRNAECGEQISRMQDQLRNLKESFAFRWFSWALPEAPRFEECAVAAPPDSFLGRWMKRLPIVGGYLKASEEAQQCELALGQMEKAAETFNDQLKSNWFLRKILPEFDLGTQVDNQVVSQGNGKLVLMGAAAFVALAGGIYWAFGRKSSSDEVGTEDNISSEEDCIGNEALQTEEIMDGVGFEEIDDEICTDEDNLSKEEENIDFEEDLQSKEIIDGKSEEKDKSQQKIIISESVQEIVNENRSKEDGIDDKLQREEIIDGKSEEKDKSQQEIIINESVQEIVNENVRPVEDGIDKKLQCEEAPEASCVETAEEDLAAEKRVEEKTLERVGPNLYAFKVSKLEWQILNGRQRREEVSEFCQFYNVKLIFPDQGKKGVGLLKGAANRVKKALDHMQEILNEDKMDYTNEEEQESIFLQLESEGEEEETPVQDVQEEFAAENTSFAAMLKKNLNEDQPGRVFHFGIVKRTAVAETQLQGEEEEEEMIQRLWEEKMELWEEEMLKGDYEMDDVDVEYGRRNTSKKIVFSGVQFVRDLQDKDHKGMTLLPLKDEEKFFLQEE
ncbi:cilia- and flagella-associated protein 251-like [Palaemon carinicauda]|uniref:cilia- and flagella-associated protein 251-like n=1 Tax=Palaemon carinicauda TaxID=392227 RepID=UPI0035B6607C